MWVQHVLLYSRENTVNVQAFVSSNIECEKSCSRDDLCGYFKYFGASDEKQPLMCYHLKSCAPRIIRSMVRFVCQMK